MPFVFTEILVYTIPGKFKDFLNIADIFTIVKNELCDHRHRLSTSSVYWKHQATALINVVKPNDCFSRHFLCFLLPTSEEMTMESASDVSYDSYPYVTLATQPLHCWWYICRCSVFSSEKIEVQSWGLFNSLMVKVHLFFYLSQSAFTWYAFSLWILT